ncbi:phosphoribosylanthranilate isomerase [Melaminivora alkalimesophila]|uniref:N-(5'-phosphoribosyl)anthranilate isomerase n=1 Tax=Melaminivora alkalimesophila TaxID=1165852 RepID=A0A317RAR1_9BURK|nr:phosphoribosylanthranilate isomerase [Melaminivora alkalimesophila]PWW45958.1 phosphoribosylanthranilate isomerase [Melaminivora alkalimesophila]
MSSPSPLSDPSAPTPSLPVRTRVKICGLTREQDVDAAVAAGADALGFVLYPRSPRALPLARAVELAARLPPFVTPVLLFVNAAPAQVREAVERIPGAMAQFHGDETPAQCLEATDGGRLPFLRAARIPLAAGGAGFDLVEYAQRYSKARAILLDALVEGYGGGGKAFDWSLLPASVNAHLVLSGGLTPANVGDGVARLRARCRSLAVDVSSGVEACAPDGTLRRGIKDAGKIARFIAAVRAADAASAPHPS